MNIANVSDHPVFSTFSESVLKHLCDFMTEVKHKEGTVIMKEGDAGDSFFIVDAGELEVRKVINRATGEYKTLARIGEREVFGEMSLFDKALRSADVVALTDVVLWQVTVPDIKGLVQSDPTTGTNFIMAMNALLTSRLRDSNETVGVLSEAGRLVSKAADLSTLTRSLFDLVVRSFEGSECSILALYNWFNDEFNVKESIQSPKSAVKTLPMVFDPSNPFVYRLMRSSEPILIKRQDVSPNKLEGIFGEARSLLATPLLYGANILGFVVLMNFQKTGVFTRQQLVLLDGLCSQVAPAIETFRYRFEEESRLRLLKDKGFTA